jgi:hypothetical protein
VALLALVTLPKPSFLALLAPMRKGDTMPIREVPRLLFSLPLSGPDAGEKEGLAVARAPGGEVVVQLALAEHRLRGFTEARPPSCSLPAEAAVALARALLAELRPDLAAALEAHERRRALRVVGSDGPEAA